MFRRQAGCRIKKERMRSIAGRLCAFACGAARIDTNRHPHMDGRLVDIRIRIHDPAGILHAADIRLFDSRKFYRAEISLTSAHSCVWADSNLASEINSTAYPSRKFGADFYATMQRDNAAKQVIGEEYPVLHLCEEIRFEKEDEVSYLSSCH